MNFSDLQLDSRLQSAIDKLGYKECTPIQEQIIPLVLAGRDVSGLAQTGTGKTAAFLLPLMDRILKGQITDWKPSHFILILVPTRELAEQVYENVTKLSEFSGLRGIAVYGGTSYDKQKEAFRNQVEFVVATPGRLIDLYKEHFIDLKQVRAVVFDEADRMFDMGFKDDMKYILQRIPTERQFLVFSATLNFDVLNTAYQFGADPVEINISRDQAKAENVRDEIFHVGQEDKPSYLLSLLKKHNPKQVIIFSNFKNNVERIAQFLSQNELPAMGISSLLTQAQRNKVLELFKAENEKNILVATDVAARGLDIKGVDMVINFELPMDAESYVHRIGRTGRAGTEGQAFSLVSDRDVDSLKRVEDYLKHKLATGWIEDQELIKDFKPFPSDRPFRDRPPRAFQERGERSGPGGFKSGPGGRPGPGRIGPNSGSGRPQRGDRYQGNRPEGDNRGPRRDSKEGRDGSGNRPDGRRSERPARTGDRPQQSESRHAHAKGPRSERPDLRDKSKVVSRPHRPLPDGNAKKPAHRPGKAKSSSPSAAKPASKIKSLFKKIFSLGSK
jgi:ATP-dependent RNA helicase RhlB